MFGRHKKAMLEAGACRGSGYTSRAVNGVISGRSSYVHHMKYLLVVLVLAAIVGAEVFHALADDSAPGSTICTASEGTAEAARDRLLMHLKSH